MKFLNKILQKDPDFASLLKEIDKNRLPLVCTGLSLIHKAVILKSVFDISGKKITVVTQDEASAVELTADAKSLGLNAVNFPLRDYCLGDFSGYSKEYEHKRIDTLSRVLDGAFDVLLIPVDAAIQYTLPPNVLSDNIINVDSNDTINTVDFCQRLVDAGYVRSELCDGVGQFAVRGGIIDVFATGNDYPVRIELWGDEVDSISYFDIESQRRTDNVSKIKIHPANELPFNPIELSQKLNKYLQSSKKLTDDQKKYIREDVLALEAGLSVSADLYIPFLYEKVATVFDYLSDTVKIVCESGNINERLKTHTASLQGSIIPTIIPTIHYLIWRARR